MIRGIHDVCVAREIREKYAGEKVGQYIAYNTVAIMEKRLTTGGSGLLLPGGQSRQTAEPGTNATTARAVSGRSG